MKAKKLQNIVDLKRISYYAKNRLFCIESIIARLNEIKEIFQLSSELSLRNVHVIRINGNDDNK